MATRTTMFLAVAAIYSSASAELGEKCESGQCAYDDEVSLLQERMRVLKPAEKHSTSLDASKAKKTKHAAPAVETSVKSKAKKTKHAAAAVKTSVKKEAKHASKAVEFGTSTCPCIGIDGIKGHIFGLVDDKNVSYPADLGAHCAAWDQDSTPGCPGADWCTEKWCYVDPCNCEGLAELPQESEYLPNAEFQGHGIYYSYVTCGSADKYTKNDTESDRVSKVDASCHTTVDAAQWGEEDCRCTGMDPVEGSITVTVSGETEDYEASYGGECGTWDAANDAKCSGNSPPDYCGEKWCYVNPDKCSKKSQQSEYLPDATSDGGHGIYFSYETCGSSHSWSGSTESSTEASTEAGSDSATDSTNEKGEVSFGEATCPCIGIDDISGDIMGLVDDKHVKYPADLGAHCGAWDEDTPGCPGADWCEQKWCYVDPCNCKGLAELPKESVYLPDAQYQGHGVYYSYVTCGSPDTYGSGDSETDRENQIKESCAKEVDTLQWGEEDCRCTGMYPVSGEMEVSVDGETEEFQAEYGSKCDDWDNMNNDKCKSEHPPSYCDERWCYVNPEKCDSQGKAKKSLMLPNSTSDGGHGIYYSYDTCGGEDKYPTASSSTEDSEASSTVTFGSGECPCIGIDGIDGHVDGDVKGKTVKYPADLGSHCKAWDEHDTPGCPGADWCSEKWCYVDPCNCNIDPLPKQSDYLGDAEYQGHSIYFSYVTCGGTDSYSDSSSDNAESREKEIEHSCSKSVDAKEWGDEDCRCTGVAPVRGKVDVTVNGKEEKYQAEYGANCAAWDDNNDEECKGEDPPDYCSEKWCYVNPDKCETSIPTKVSAYLPDATSDSGKPVHFSYDTCGGTDKFSKGDSDDKDSKATEDLAKGSAGYRGGAAETEDEAQKSDQKSDASRVPVGFLVFMTALFIHH